MPLILGSRSWKELCESRGGRPGLPVTNSPYGLCGRKATLSSNSGESMLFCKPFWFSGKALGLQAADGFVALTLGSNLDS